MKFGGGSGGKSCISSLRNKWSQSSELFWPPLSTGPCVGDVRSKINMVNCSLRQFRSFLVDGGAPLSVAVSLVNYPTMVVCLLGNQQQYFMFAVCQDTSIGKETDRRAAHAEGPMGNKWILLSPLKTHHDMAIASWTTPCAQALTHSLGVLYDSSAFSHIFRCWPSGQNTDTG